MTLKRSSWLTTIVVLTLALAACGGQGSSSPSGTASSTSIYSGLTGQNFTLFDAGATGIFNQALQATFVNDFNTKTGMIGTIEQGPCGITKLAGEEAANNVTVDAYLFCTPSDWKVAEQQNLLVKLNPAVIPLDLLQPGSYDSYGYQSFQFAAALVYNTNAYPSSAKQPTTIEDIFNTTAFPGQRCLYNYPQFYGVLESALLASGVAPNQLYPLNVPRALTELHKIRPQTTFFSTAAQGFQLMLTGQCKMGIFPNGSTYDTIRTNPGAPLAVAFGHAIVTAGVMAIPKGTPNLQAAEAFLKWIIEDSTGQVNMLKQTSYLSAELKSPPSIPSTNLPFALVGKNAANTIAEDDTYYASSINQVLSAFNAWLASG